MEEQRRARPGIPFGRVAGVPVFLTGSWLVLAVGLVFAYGTYLQVRLPAPLGYLVGAGLVAGLTASVLLHELGHAFVARHLGMGVRGITLNLRGGYTELAGEAPSPRVELAVSLAGPAVSLALGLLALVFALLLPVDTLAHTLAGQLAFANLVVAAFNVLPGLPLDGGRALRAGIWALSHDRYRGDRVAGRVGRVLAVGSVLAAFGLYLANVIGFLGAVLTIMVALTLWAGAGQSIRAGELGPRVPLLDARQLARPILPVHPDTPLSEALRRYADAAAPAEGRAAPVLGVVNSAGQLVGLVDETAASRVPAERQPWVTAGTVSRALAPGRILPAELTGLALVEAVRSSPASEYVVTVGEDVLGVLRVADVMQVLESRGPTR